jgi:ketosteroid isomerase-like protein
MNNTNHLLSRYIKRAVSVILFHFIVLGVSAQSRNDTLVRATIRLLNQQMEDAFNANDMQKVAAFYSDDAQIVYDNGYTVKGRTNLDNYWASLKDKGRGWKLSVVEVGGDGEIVFQLGKSDLKHMNGTKEANSITNFIVLWKKQSDGSYKIFRDYLTKTSFVK